MHFCYDFWNKEDGCNLRIIKSRYLGRIKEEFVARFQILFFKMWRLAH